MELSKELVEILKETIFKYPNVIGFSHHYRNRIKNNKVIENTQVIRIYVKKKIPEYQLKSNHIIPKTIHGIETDIVEIGEVKAQSTTQYYRPLKFGTSVGHYDITAGTLSIPFKDNNGNIYLSSNAHVLTPDPSLTTFNEKRILQPGPYDIVGNKNDPKYLCGYYYYHKVLYPISGLSSNCLVGKLFTGTYNLFAKLLKRKTRLYAYVPPMENTIDFALFKPIVPYDDFLDFNPDGNKFIGLLFAGSELSTIICKVKYMVELGFTPLHDYGEAKLGDFVQKMGRTTQVTKGQITDESATVVVNYDTYNVEFTDVYVATAMSEPGDSGSSVFLAN